MRRWQSWATGIVALSASAVIGGAVPGAGAPEEAIVLTGGHGGYSDYRFDIRVTSVKGLVPGARKNIDVTLVNSYPFPLRVTSVKGELVASNKRGCRATSTNLRVAPFSSRLPLTIPASSRRSAGHVEVRMPNTVVDACQRATFTVRISGSATKASR